MIHVVAAGLASTLQDRGRYRHGRAGVPPSGPADPFACAAALALARAAVAIEIVGAPFSVVSDEPRLVAATGPEVSLRVGSRRVPGWMAAYARAGDEIRVVASERARYAYLAIAGRPASEPVLGSWSTYLPAGLGPCGRALRAGDELAIGAPDAGPDRAGARLDPPEYAGAIAAVRGPHDDRFADPDAFFRMEFEVDEASDRMGTRLRGGTLRAPEDELLTCGVVAGAMQVPRGGLPIVLGPDHQTTGGYAVIATVASADLGRVAQSRPGERLRFVEVDATRAAALLRVRSGALLAMR